MAYGIRDLACSFAGIKQNSDRLRRDEFWALRDISLDLKQGEALGIMGANGSGKSTLLRILNGIFLPDSGSVQIQGRVGGLIALGAGMHPHMTGRENVYLNGSILGLSRRQIHRSLDEIVDFADIGEFLDAPVATYSSGMKVRLGFAIAIQQTPEILLIDEILAVGDLNFRLKCYRKLTELFQKGSTILLVSHNDTAIKSVCSKLAILHRSRLLGIGSVDRMIARYRNIALREVIGNRRLPRSPVTPKTGPILIGKVNIKRVIVRDGAGNTVLENGTEVSKVPYSSVNTLTVEIEVHISEPIDNARIETSLRDVGKIEENVVCGATFTKKDDSRLSRLEQGRLAITCTMDVGPIAPGLYHLYFILGDDNFLNRKYAFIDFADNMTIEIVPSSVFAGNDRMLNTPYYFPAKHLELRT